MRLWMLSLLVATVSAAGLLAQEADFDRWEPAIQQFEQQDAEQSPKPGGTMFIGSSSIRLWKLDESFPGKGYVNRGFGGSEIADSVHFFERIVLPHRPATLVMYAGDNDVANGKSPQRVLADFKEFVGLVRKHLPETRVVYIAIKPSERRWELVDQMRKANDLIAAFARETDGVTFVDIFEPMLGEDGRPRPELYVSDQLHMSPAGYRLWTERVSKALRED